MEKRGIRLVAVGGSVRPGNFTSKALALVVDEVRRNPDLVLDAIDLAKIQISLPGTALSEDAGFRGWFRRPPAWCWPRRNTMEATAV